MMLRIMNLHLLPQFVCYDNRNVPITYQARPRVRSITARYLAHKQCFSLIIPQKIARKTVEEFLHTHHDVLCAHLATLPTTIPLMHGQKIPIFDEMHELVALPTELPYPTLCVPTSAAQCPSMTKKILEGMLRERLELSIALALTNPIFSHLHDVRPRLTLRDSHSRWASCAPNGDMMFSWRLAFAPLHVVHYVAMHETAHLIHRNHSPAFWQLTRTLCRDTDRATGWLKQHGKELFRYV
jgi:predicted metal-dependent hydrolase